MSSARLTLEIPSCLESVALLGRAVHGACAAAALEKQACAEVELSVAEAVTNCIRHAYGGAAGHVVEVELAAHPDRVEVEIRDQGAPLPAELCREPPLPPPGQEGGRGLFLIFKLMDRVRFAAGPKGNCLTLVRYRGEVGCKVAAGEVPEETKDGIDNPICE